MKFTSLTAHQIKQALERLMEPNKNEADACDARSEIDLRVGAAFTRFQTLRLQQMYSSLADQVVSYGGCQFPTLGFVVDRYRQREVRNSTNIFGGREAILVLYFFCMHVQSCVCVCVCVCVCACVVVKGHMLSVHTMYSICASINIRFP